MFFLFLYQFKIILALWNIFDIYSLNTVLINYNPDFIIFEIKFVIYMSIKTIIKMANLQIIQQNFWIINLEKIYQNEIKKFANSWKGLFADET